MLTAVQQRRALPSHTAAELAGSREGRGAPQVAQGGRGPREGRRHTEGAVERTAALRGWKWPRPWSARKPGQGQGGRGPWGGAPEAQVKTHGPGTRPPCSQRPAEGRRSDHESQVLGPRPPVPRTDVGVSLGRGEWRTRRGQPGRGVSEAHPGDSEREMQAVHSRPEIDSRNERTRTSTSTMHDRKCPTSTPGGLYQESRDPQIAKLFF